MTLKAIETVYKGYRFRSRLEARWAVFFDALGVKYEYEKEGYDFDGIRYLPDFWLPEQRYWIEVKPKEPDAAEITKARLLAGLMDHQSSTPWTVFIFNGEPYWRGAWGGYYKDTDPSAAYDNLEGDQGFVWGYEFEIEPNAYGQGVPYWSVSRDGKIKLGSVADQEDIRVNGYNFWHPRLVHAYLASRQARFEFGETPR